jgi:Icc-related predicted phosphoesterase
MTSEAPPRLRVAAIGDLHVRMDDQFPYRAMFSEISKEADALALCGDLTDLGRIEEAEVLVQDLRSCTVPVVAVLGNHDYESGHGDDVCRILRQGAVHVLEGQTTDINGVSFSGVKGFCGGFGRHMLGAFGEGAIKSFVQESLQEAMRLENALRTAHGRTTVVVLHYAPISETLEGEPPEIYPFLGNTRLGETIDRFPVSAVFHGHAHHGRYEGRTHGGVPVYNVALPIEKPSGKLYTVVEV